jgi:predicted transport protein
LKNILFRLEKEIQVLVEKKLMMLLNLAFIRSEFSLNNFRIDTLAFDKETKSFVIIEYKRDKNFSVIDQGYAYLSLMLNNKADFILEFNESQQTILKRTDVYWSQSKVIQKKVTRDVSNVGHWGNGSYEIKVIDLDDIDYIISLLKQSVRKNKK